jgi:hypothetical protein
MRGVYRSTLEDPSPQPSPRLQREGEERHLDRNVATILISVGFSGTFVTIPHHDRRR